MIPRSTLYSVGLALAYGALATAYIVVSGSLAASHSASVEELARIETIKGVLYVAVTTLGVFFGGLIAMRRMERDATELVRRERALVANEGRVFAGVMAASVAHDANNVLFAVLGDLELLAESTDFAGSRHVEQLRRSVSRLVALNKRLLTAARHGVPKERHPVDLARLVRDCVAEVRPHAHLRNCRVICRGDEHMPTETQPLLVHQIVSNLVLNAGEATQGRGTIEVATFAADGELRIEVHDDGPGVPRDRRHTLFESLASTKATGSGLGLFSVRACAQGLGGTVEIDDSQLGGALFRVRLPKQPIAVPV